LDDLCFPGSEPWPGHKALHQWFLDRALATSRYALFICQRQSGLGYEKWCQLFDLGLDSKNPWATLANEYPFLIRQLGHLYRDLRSAMIEMLDRLTEDREQIARRFSIRLDDPIVDLEAGLSDPHRGGRSVMRLYFASGASLIYKPKPVAVEGFVNAFLASHGADFGLTSLKVLDQETHGWVEDAGRVPKYSETRASGEDMGRAAAFFWLLNATDLHLENMQVVAEGITCLDLETLLCAPVATVGDFHASWQKHSITSTLLFDASVYAHRRIANISGFDPAPWTGSLAPEVEFVLEHDVVKMVTTPSRGSQPLAGPMVAGNLDAELILEIEKGFRSATRSVSRRRLEALIHSFPDDLALRFVLRETFFYERIRERMRQPRLLRNEAGLREDLAVLHRGISASALEAELLHRIVEDEIRQLMHGDIPYFSCSAGDRSLELSDGSQIPFFAVEPKQFALSKISEASEADIEEQITLIRISLGYGPPRSGPAAAPVAAVGLESDLAWLCRTICSSAFRAKVGPSRWLSLHGDVSREDLRISVGATALFGGSLGIVLALQAAETALADIVAVAFLDEEAERWGETPPDRIPLETTACLGFSGLGGDLFGMAELMRLAPRRWSFLWNAIWTRITAAGDLLERDTLIDVIGGRAGLIIGLLRVLEAAPPAEIRRVAKSQLLMCAESLIGCAEQMPAGVAWRVPIEDRPLLGYAHGWAGMVAALAGAYEHTNQETLTTQIETCLARAVQFLEGELMQHGTFIEHRSGHGVGSELNASWCNGVPGFLRGLLAARVPRSEMLRDVVGGLVRRTEAEIGTAPATRFCCGDMGAVDFALDLARATSDPSREAAAVAAGRKTVRRACTVAQGPAADLRPEVAFPGLFQNLGGILYTGCRLKETQLVSLSGQPMGHLVPG
jgi:type 2 lantibiotic biosynthesis protein LanM